VSTADPAPRSSEFKRPGVAGRAAGRRTQHPWPPRKEANVWSQHRCNEQIRISPIRLIDHNNNQMGIVPTDEARRMAFDAGLDLVEVAPNERPPVCRIMDYGKFKYAQKKKKQKHHEQKLKEVRLHPKISDHDRDRLMARAAEFIERGTRSILTMTFAAASVSTRTLGQSSSRPSSKSWART